MLIAKLARSLSYTSRAGKLARLPLSLVPDNRVVPILAGINKGMKWITGSGPSRACWLGSYEADHVSALPKLIRPGMTAYDVGANTGFYTLALSKLVGPSGRVFAFEPEATNVHFLRRHIKLNGLTNVTIVQAAVSSEIGMVPFEGSGATGGVSRQSSYLVPSISLDEFNAPSPSFIKMDIEGAELLALRGAKRLLEQARPALCLATHSPQLRSESMSILSDLGYRFTDFDCENEPQGEDFVAIS